MESELKKIGILAFVDSNSGGVYQYTQSLIDALANDKKHTYIIFIDSPYSMINSYDLEVRSINLKKPNILIKLLKALQLFTLLKSSILERVERRLYNDIDLFFCPRVIMYTQFFVTKPFILTFHDLQEVYYPNYFSFGEKIIRYSVNRFLCRKAERIICESNYVKNDIGKFIKIKEDKIIVLTAPPPALFLSVIINEEKKQEIKKKYRLPNDFLFYPASFWYHKNHIKLIEAFSIVLKSNNEIFLVLSGSKQNNYPLVIQKIKELKLQKNIIIVGYIDYDDLPYLYSMSKLLVMPSLFESISIPVYEAFAMKIPVCVSNVVALPEQVGDAGLLFDPNNENDIAEKINLLLNDSHLQHELGLKGYNKVNNYSHRAYENSLVNLIDNILF